MTEEYGHISDAFDNLPEEELLMTEQERKALEALDKLYKENGDAMTKLAKIEMTEEQLDSLRFKLGGDWYDTWWVAIVERFDPMPLGFGEPTFFDLINDGWLEMYGEFR